MSFSSALDGWAFRGQQDARWPLLSSLARYLDARGVVFEPFEDFYDVLALLDAGGPVVPPTRRRGRNT